MEEEIFLNDGRVFISSARVTFENETFSTRDIVSFREVAEPASSIPIILPLGIFLLLMLHGKLMASLFFLAGACLAWAMKQDKWAIYFQMRDGDREKKVFISENIDLSHRVAKAINQSFEHYRRK